MGKGQFHRKCSGQYENRLWIANIRFLKKEYIDALFRQGVLCAAKQRV